MNHDDRLDLSIEQGALLWCVRVWVAGLQRMVPVRDRVQDVMDQLGAPGAGRFFEGYMAAIRLGALRTIAVDCVCRPGVNDDERALLDILALAQERRLFEATLLLRGLVTPAGAAAALGSAEALGAALARAGRFLPAPDDEVRRFAIAGQSLQRGGATVH